ncbi:hypothetical protein ColTof4_07410 [Colletotrichum tofieldiae]|nr:hypothetical protein ColTof3_12358 [Colletotrichum tofieldiae]GKT74987.1 hypothetical protein ColTof4_07410 [Colletotrichum tofieldiae]GKT92205.1 hypothetical protein Ct61P_10055 [Colletotrichum tofieldiae]
MRSDPEREQPPLFAPFLGQRAEHIRQWQQPRTTLMEKNAQCCIVVRPGHDLGSSECEPQPQQPNNRINPRGDPEGRAINMQILRMAGATEDGAESSLDLPSCMRRAQPASVTTSESQTGSESQSQAYGEWFWPCLRFFRDTQTIMEPHLVLPRNGAEDGFLRGGPAAPAAPDMAPGVAGHYGADLEQPSLPA